MEQKKYVRLADVGTFTVHEAYGFQWKLWDQETKRMLILDKWQAGAKKVYSIKTNKGYLDISQAQLGQMLEATYSKGKADIAGRNFTVKTNGKTGIEIRYFINLAKDAPMKTHEERPADEPPPIEEYF